MRFFEFYVLFNIEKKKQGVYSADLHTSNLHPNGLESHIYHLTIWYI